MNMYLQPLQTNINTITSLYSFFQNESTAKLQNSLFPFLKHWKIHREAMLKQRYEVKSLLQHRTKIIEQRCIYRRLTGKIAVCERETSCFSPSFPVVSCLSWLTNVLIWLCFLSYCNYLSLKAFGKHRVCKYQVHHSWWNEMSEAREKSHLPSTTTSWLCSVQCSVTAKAVTVGPRHSFPTHSLAI